MMKENYKVIKVHPSDNVIVALEDIPAGATVMYENATYKIVDDVAAKFLDRPLHEIDSKTTSPVLTSISDTDGLLNSGSTASREKTLAAEMGSNAEVLGVIANAAAVSSAARLTKLFI